MATDGGANFRQAKRLGILRPSSSRRVSLGFIQPGEGRDWYRFRVLGNTSAGFFNYSSSSPQGAPVFPRVDLYFQPNSRGRLRRVRTFPATAGAGSTSFTITGAGSYYVRLLARPVSGDLRYSFGVAGFGRANGSSLFR